MNESVHPSARQLACAGEWFLRAIANRDDSRGKHLGLSGSAGCGKSHVARNVYRFISSWSVDIGATLGAANRCVAWISWPQLAESDDEDDFRAALYELDLSFFLVIDDIGSEADRFKNGIPASRLRRILELVEKKWVIVTSNLTLEAMIDLYDARNADRLRAYHWVTVGDVPSYRPRLKGNNRGRI